jgi:hypothetical protein
MNQIVIELRQEIAAQSSNALRLLDEAKWLQQQLSTLPILNRQSAMNKVNFLQKEAVRAAQKSIELQSRLTAVESE